MFFRRFGSFFRRRGEGALEPRTDRIGFRPPSGEPPFAERSQQGLVRRDFERRRGEQTVCPPDLPLLLRVEPGPVRVGCQPFVRFSNRVVEGAVAGGKPRKWE